MGNGGGSVSGTGENLGLFVDATDLVSVAAFPLTGISRVQSFLVRQACLDDDPLVGAVVFDEAKGIFRRMNPDEEERLNSTDFRFPGSTDGTLEKYRKAFALAKRAPNLRKDFDRLAAAAITGKGPASLRFRISKIVVRSYRLFWKLLSSLQAGDKGAADPRPVRGTVLFSDPAGLGRSFHAAMQATSRRAFICHDLIPFLQPEHVGTQSYAAEFAGKFSHLVATGSHALCVSRHTLDCFSRAFPAVGGNAPRADVIPMPSILYDQADSLGLTSRLPAREPFVLYCSTVEIRKNHILLARIWKRALDEGVRLPKLICVGKRGWLIAELQAYMAANPQLAGHVDFVGQVSDLELIELYRSALFGVIPSRDEGWGLGASECLDFGTPVIVSTAPALQEAVRGLMPAIDPDDEVAWYAAIRRMSEDTAYRESLGSLIKKAYRPVHPIDSWAAIKATLLPDAVATVAPQQAGMPAPQDLHAGG